MHLNEVNKIFKRFSVFLLAWLYFSTAIAATANATTGTIVAPVKSTASAKKDIAVIVKLVDIKAERTAEKRGDEIYFHTTQYSSSGGNQENRIPIFPDHWLSKQLNKVKDVVLWQGDIQSGESVRIIISLLEQDLAPWEVDDLLGSAQLVMDNKNGKLGKHWSIPTSEVPREVEMLRIGEPQRYVFKGAGALYDVAFQVEQRQN